MPSKTLGILGGMGPAATANFLRLLVSEFNAAGVFEDSDFPQIIMLSLNLALGDWDHTGSKNLDNVRDNVLAGVDWLKFAGADVIAVPCNSVHEFVSGYDRVINIVNETLKLCKPGLVGVLCSAQVRDSRLYESAGHEILYHSSQDSVDSVIRSIMYGTRCDIGLMINGAFPTCSSVVLGCTELSLCSISRALDKHIVDSTLALARATVRRCMSS